MLETIARVKYGLLLLRALVKQIEDTANDFGADLDKLTRQAYRGRIGATRFEAEMSTLLLYYLKAAYIDGYIESGLDENDLDDADKQAINNELKNQRSYIDGFAQAVFEAKDESELKPQIDQRVTYWTRSIAAMGQLAKANAKPRKRFMWKLGDAEEHCKTCNTLNEQVHTMRWYVERGYVPQKPGAAMDCKGFRCKCELIEV